MYPNVDASCYHFRRYRRILIEAISQLQVEFHVLLRKQTDEPPAFAVLHLGHSAMGIKLIPLFP